VNATIKKNIGHAKRQKRYRERLRREGCKRLDVAIPGDLWIALQEHLAQIPCGLSHPGRGVVKLLKKTFMPPEQKVAQPKKQRNQG